MANEDYETPDLSCEQCGVSTWTRDEEARCTRTVTIYGKEPDSAKVDAEAWVEDEEWNGNYWSCINGHDASDEMYQALNDIVEGY